MTYPPMPVKEKKIRKPLSEAVPDVILGVLAVAGLMISGWSLGTLMHGQAGAPWWVAMFAVAVFDLVAMAATLLVYQRRHDPWSAAGARVVMTGALMASAVVNGAHGYALGGWTTAAVLAAAPMSFEVAFELRHRTLTALIWIMFRKQAMTRLKYDAWTRIAMDAGPGRMTLDGSPQDIADTIRALEDRDGPAPVPVQDRDASRDGPVPVPVQDRPTADLIRDLIAEGVGSPPEISRRLSADGVSVEPAYVRRVVRASKNGSGS